jgi:NAD-dependent protein deacetylase/lipoamidase
MAAVDLDLTVRKQRDELVRLVGEAQTVVGFTGAGISTESGIPDFRSPGGLWTKNQPIPFDEFLSSASARREAWRRKFEMDPVIAKAKPGRGHMAMSRLVAAGKMSGVITQNIDNLHQLSGVPAERVVELHGNGTYAHCLDCGVRHELADIKVRFESTGEAPMCAECGGVVKSATISFGQAMPELAMQRARDLSLNCDLFLTVGSSLVVQPAAWFPVVAKDAGARLVIVNREATPLDSIADLVINADIGSVLSPLAPLM